MVLQPKPFTPLESVKTISLHDTTERVPPILPWRLNRAREWGLGSRRYDSPSSAQADTTAQEAAARHRTRSGGVCENDSGRERLGSTERGSSSHAARGVGHS